MSTRKPGRPKAVKPVKKSTLHIEVPKALKDAVEALAGRNQRKITGEVILAIEEHLKRSGAVPPPAESE